ncbi:hypothetical protein MIH18_00480 [Marinobacter sp. M3C]|uniref:hypothetical protein n=1 Tax=Marinobacter sp. M3C TaxID=2917715 RepID=UPI0020105D45|nr:hypothetical protein [Marinobacter sp. M3C]UQG60480.1 hypothetical protein MIH18_00480 [Marinobacter sp. M3C]
MTSVWVLYKCGGTLILNSASIVDKHHFINESTFFSALLRYFANFSSQTHNQYKHKVIAGAEETPAFMVLKITGAKAESSLRPSPVG